MGRGANGLQVPAQTARMTTRAQVEPDMRVLLVNGGANELVVFGDPVADAVEQMTRCLSVETGAKGVLCSDNHKGFCQPVGGVIGYRELISVSGVGPDIGCGNKAVLTNLTTNDIDIIEVMDEIEDKISFGVGRKNQEPVDHPVLDKIRQANFKPQRKLIQMAEQSLGTVGSSNHFVDIFADEQNRIWVGVHFGSRGFGFKTAQGFAALAAGDSFEDKAKEKPMDGLPLVFRTDSAIGQDYIEAMNLAGEYAYAGRDVVVDKVLEILGGHSQFEVHNNHNLAWQENHGGEDLWVVRKGATPAFPGQPGFVGANMEDSSVILRGGEDSEASRMALYSTMHGAGRVMSRTQAAGKFKRRKYWTCTDKHCDYTTTDFNSFSCPHHPNGQSKKHTWREKVRDGEVDFPAVRKRLAAKGVELRGGGADEAKEAYKLLEDNIATHGKTIQVEHQLRPLGVAMAPDDEFDPFKD